MLEDDQRTAVVIAIFVIVGLEVWRRSLRHRAPTWVHIVTVVLLAIVGGGVAYTQWQLSRVMASIDATNASEKATALARGMSRAMTGNALALLGVVLAAIVLGIGTYLARRIPDPGDAPVAQTH